MTLLGFALAAVPWWHPPAEDRVMVVVAARDLAPGVPIGPDDLYGLAVAARFLPDGVYLSPDQVVGRYPTERILANEPVRGERLYEGGGSGLSAILPPGTRAVTLALALRDPVSTVLRPGNRVDVGGVDADGDEVSVPYVAVLDAKPGSVTILADPARAEALASIAPGTPRVTLRSDCFVSEPEVLPGVGLHALFDRLFVEEAPPRERILLR